MSKLSFFTPIDYRSSPKSINSNLLEKVDNYFYLGGKKAHVIQGRTKTKHEKVMLSESCTSALAKVGKILSYFTIVIPLIMLIAKTILRSQHSYKIINPKQQLEKGINISEATIAKIQQLIPKIIKREDDTAIEWLAKGNNLVFRIKETPELVYKLAPPGSLILGDKKFLDSKQRSDQRFENMVKAKEVCLTNDLGLLIIPHAKKFAVEVNGVSYTLIAEESLEFNHNESAHEELYHKYSTELNETARQLSIFIAKTGFNDVAWRNIPILNEVPTFQGDRRIALIDLESMNSAKNGFLGDINGSRGLIRCVSEKQIDNVVAEACKTGGITEEQANEAKKYRLKELQDDQLLRTFHARKGIKTGKEPLKVDLKSLGLDLTEQAQINVTVGVDGNKFKREKQSVTLKKVAKDVIDEINKLIQNSSDQASTKGKRYFVLNTTEHPLSYYHGLGLSSKILIDEKDEKKLWIRRIIQALIDKGHIFKLDKVNGHGYFIQA